MTPKQKKFIERNCHLLVELDSKYEELVLNSLLALPYKILEYLRKQPEEEISCEEISKELKINLNSVHIITRLLAANNLIEKSTKGKKAYARIVKIECKSNKLKDIEFLEKIKSFCLEGISIKSMPKRLGIRRNDFDRRLFDLTGKDIYAYKKDILYQPIKTYIEKGESYKEIAKKFNTSEAYVSMVICFKNPPKKFINLLTVKDVKLRDSLLHKALNLYLEGLNFLEIEKKLSLSPHTIRYALDHYYGYSLDKLRKMREAKIISEIKIYQGKGLSIEQIAKYLERDVSTLYRLIKRNKNNE